MQCARCSIPTKHVYDALVEGVTQTLCNVCIDYFSKPIKVFGRLRAELEAGHLKLDAAVSSPPRFRFAPLIEGELAGVGSIESVGSNRLLMKRMVGSRMPDGTTLFCHTGEDRKTEQTHALSKLHAGQIVTLYEFGRHCKFDVKTGNVDGALDSVDFRVKSVQTARHENEEWRIFEYVVIEVEPLAEAVRS